MTQTTTTVAVCEATKPHSLHPWRCMRKAGHDLADGHSWPIESEHYNYPLDQYSAEWLASELRLQLAQNRDLKRRHADWTANTESRFSTLIAGLIKLAPANSKRKNVPVSAVHELWQEAVHGSTRR